MDLTSLPGFPAAVEFGLSAAEVITEVNRQYKATQSVPRREFLNALPEAIEAFQTGTRVNIKHVRTRSMKNPGVFEGEGTVIGWMVQRCQKGSVWCVAISTDKGPKVFVVDPKAYGSADQPQLFFRESDPAVGGGAILRLDREEGRFGHQNADFALWKSAK
jgi:hypothetical protein